MVELQAIESHASPYNQLHKVSGLVETVEAVNVSILTEQREQALAAIDQKIALLQAEIAKSGIESAELSNRLLRPLQLLKAEAETETSLAHIYQLESQTAEERLQDGIFELERAIQAEVDRQQKLQQQAEKAAQQTAQGSNQVKEERTPPPVPVKPVAPPKPVVEIAATSVFNKLGNGVYWLSDQMRQLFVAHKERLKTNSGLTTGDNERFVRFWWDVSAELLGLGIQSRAESLSAAAKWYPYNKGGDYRRWYGNDELVVNWYKDGREIQSTGRCVLRSKDEYFKPGVTWGGLTSSAVSFRLSEVGHLFDSNKGPMIFGPDDHLLYRLGLLNSTFSHEVLQSLNPTISTQTGDIERIPAPYFPSIRERVQGLVQDLVDIACKDWNAYERSWGFQFLPILTASSEPAPTLESSYNAWITLNRETIAEMQRLEEENNRLFIDAYGLTDELTPDVRIEQITLTVNPAYRYGGKLSEAELWTRFREDSMQELVSYAVGCMMGRYSLDEPGLIYAHSGNQGFDPSRYTRFPADADGILPLTDKEWFADDAANRLIEFISVAWDKTHLEANLRFLADNLAPKKTESSRDTLRRYLCDNFFKDHLQTYKKRPIYWLFSSGKQKAFQCLVYLHRYNEGTLARMRTEYVIPLSAKLSSYAAKLEKDIEASNSTAEKKALEKQLSTLHNQQAELATFDEKLRHYADQRISLDLDDGVKVNYGKFGDLLAEVKAVTGDKAD